MLDLKLAGGRVVDGTGAPPRRADVGITGTRIAALGDLTAAPARRTLDVSGLLVCPGFIDAHSHSDVHLLVAPAAPSKIHQGVTTEVIGNCGASAAPRFGAARLPADWEALGLPGTWTTFGEYRRLLEAARPAVNVVALVGHNLLRAGVVGYADRAATADEVRTMLRRLEQALDDGARGLSTGLIYPPGLFAGADEVAALADCVGRRGGVYASHLRNEGAGLIAALEEFLAAGRTGQGRLQISHLKTSGRENWARLDQALELIRRARATGSAVAADRYPYTAAWTDLDVVLPKWAKAGGRDAILARLRDPALRARLREELASSRPPEAWADVTIGSVTVAEYRHLQGLALSEAARQLGREPVDTVLELLDRDELRTGAFFAGMSEENLRRILAEPYVMIGSDASLRTLDGPLSRDFPHPRAFGTFPKFLRLALEGRTVPLPEAIRKMTALPAEHFGLRERGRLAVGCYADVVAFRPETVRDRASYGQPRLLPDGIELVIVNGVVTLEGGALTGARAGCVL